MHTGTFPTWSLRKLAPFLLSAERAHFVWITHCRRSVMKAWQLPSNSEETLNISSRWGVWPEIHWEGQSPSKPVNYSSARAFPTAIMASTVRTWPAPCTIITPAANCPLYSFPQLTSEVVMGSVGRWEARRGTGEVASMRAGFRIIGRVIGGTPTCKGEVRGWRIRGCCAIGGGTSFIELVFTGAVGVRLEGLGPGTEAFSESAKRRKKNQFLTC